MKSIDPESAYGIATRLLDSTTKMNYQDAKFSTTSDNIYDVYAFGQVGYFSTSPGTVSFTYSGRVGKKLRGARAK
jgi:hypothetical protein